MNFLGLPHDGNGIWFATQSRNRSTRRSRCSAKARGASWRAAPISTRRSAPGRSPKTCSTSTGLSELRGIAETATHLVIGARTSWTDIIRASAAAGLRCAEAGGARGRLGPDPEHRHRRRQYLQRLAGRRRRSGAARSSTPRSRSPAAAGKRHEPLENFHPRQSPDGACAGRNGDGDPPAQDIAGRRIVLLQARCAALSRDLDRHGGGADRGRRRRQDRRCGDRGRRMLGGGAAPARARGRIARAKHPMRSPICRCPKRHFADLTPIDDVRGSADYRRDAAREIVSRALAATAVAIAPRSEAGSRSARHEPRSRHDRLHGQRRRRSRSACRRCSGCPRCCATSCI